MKDKKHGLSTFKEEDKLVLKDVIGGLEKKKYGLDFGVFKGEKEGHNQLCNREVKIDMKEMFITLMKTRNHLPTLENAVRETWDIEQLKIYFPFEWKYAEALAKAIEQGKVIKVVK